MDKKNGRVGGRGDWVRRGASSFRNHNRYKAPEWPMPQHISKAREKVKAGSCAFVKHPSGTCCIGPGDEHLEHIGEGFSSCQLLTEG